MNDSSIVFLGTEPLREIAKGRDMRTVLFLKYFYSFVKVCLYVGTSEKCSLVTKISTLKRT